MIINSERVQKAKTIAYKAATHGLAFCGGVLVGTICGVILFFKISDGDY